MLGKIFFVIWDNCKEIVYYPKSTKSFTRLCVWWSSKVNLLTQERGYICHRPGGVLPGILGGCVPPGSSNPDPISDKKKSHFPHPFSDLVSEIHTRFQTWKRITKRNITCLHKTEIMSSLLRLKPPEKDFFNTISNSHITLSFLFMWNWNDEQTDTQP